MKYFKLLSFVIFWISPIQSQEILLESFGPTFSEPIEIKNAGDDRLFVVEKSGVIKILNADESVNSTPFLDISSIVNSSSSERGLLGLAFHPDYPSTPDFFVNYINNSSNTVIAKYSLSGNPDVAINSGTILLTISQPYGNHNGGCLNFGPDGYLYIATGDGGDGGDPQDRAQNLNSLLGKILRIDIDNGSPYGIPADNPYLNDNDSNTLPEIWAYGLRNPWKFSFDDTTNNLWIADVGQEDYEEINLVSYTSSGLNYGWRCYEGNAAYNTAGCPASNTMTFPVSEYSHLNSGNFKCSITGGYVYRGTEQTNLQGKYIFADYCSEEIGILSENGGTWNYTFTSPFSGNNWVTFGENSQKELFIASQGGNIFKIVENNLGVDEYESNGIKIYPNPSKDIIYIELDNQLDTVYTINVYSILGKNILSFENINSNIFEISMQNIQNGIYNVELINQNGTKIQKKIIIN